MDRYRRWSGIGVRRHESHLGSNTHNNVGGSDGQAGDDGEGKKGSSTSKLDRIEPLVFVQGPIDPILYKFPNEMRTIRTRTNKQPCGRMSKSAGVL